MMVFIGVFVCLLGLPAIVGFFALIYMMINVVINRSKRFIISNDDEIIESFDTPPYEPAIMGYLMNFQRIGEREIYATIFDLIGRDIIIIDKKQIIEENKETFIFVNNIKNQRLNEYED